MRDGRESSTEQPARMGECRGVRSSADKEKTLKGERMSKDIRQTGGLPSAGFPYMDVIVDTEKSNFGGRVGRKHPTEVSSRKSEERELTSKQKSHKAAFYTGHCLKFLLWLSSCSLVLQS